MYISITVYLSTSKVCVFSPLPAQDDMMLCSILDKLEPQYISGYHEHDSLLEHIYDEELTEEEKKAAWENYKQQTSVEAQR